MLLQKQKTICIKVNKIQSWGPLSDSTVLDETWALARASNKLLYAFALLWTSYSLSFGDSDSGHNTSKMVGGVKQHLETNPIPARDAQRVQTKPCVHQDPHTPQRLTRPVFESPGRSQQWPAAGALGAATWSHSLWHKPSLGRSPLTPP